MLNGWLAAVPYSGSCFKLPVIPWCKLAVSDNRCGWRLRLTIAVSSSCAAPRSGTRRPPISVVSLFRAVWCWWRLAAWWWWCEGTNPCRSLSSCCGGPPWWMDELVFLEPGAPSWVGGLCWPVIVAPDAAATAAAVAWCCWCCWCLLFCLVISFFSSLNLFCRRK